MDDLVLIVVEIEGGVPGKGLVVDRLGVEHDVKTIILYRTDVLHDRGETSGMDNGAVEKEVGSELMVIRNIQIDTVLEEAHVETYVKLSGLLPPEV